MSKKLINQIISNLDDNKALDINSLSLKGKSDIADYLIIATGTSSRHVSSLAEKTVDDLKKNNKSFDYLIYLQPTSPLRNKLHIDNALRVVFKKKSLGFIYRL